MTLHVTLGGDIEARYEVIKGALERRYGRQLTNGETLELLMNQFDPKTPSIELR